MCHCIVLLGSHGKEGFGRCNKRVVQVKCLNDVRILVSYITKCTDPSLPCDGSENKTMYHDICVVIVYNVLCVYTCIYRTLVVWCRCVCVLCVHITFGWKIEIQFFFLQPRQTRAGYWTHSTIHSGSWDVSETRRCYTNKRAYLE